MLPGRVPPVLVAGVLALGLTACSDDGGGNDGQADDGATDAAPAAEAATPELEPLPTDVPYAVGYRDVVYVDPSRRTARNGTYPGAPDRTLTARVWYPATGEPGGDVVDGAAADQGPFPLVLFSHGFLANGVLYFNLVDDLAASGYVIAAPTYPLSNGDAPGGPQTNDVVNQPADASFVIDQVLADPAFAPSIDPDRIGAAGHSLGAITTLGLSLASCCADDRIDAAVAYSGRSVLGPDSFAEAVPLLLIHGERDETVAYQGSVDTFAEAQSPKYFVTLIDSGHVEGFAGGDSEQAEIIVASTLDFFDSYLKGDDEGIDRLEEDADLPGVSTLQVEE